MGVKGFTKYINDKSDLYLRKFKLHDCVLIIDGHSVSCQLYNWKHWQFDAKCTKCYGGDYDKYAYAVDYFFTMLLEAKIIPYVIFDGGFEKRKLPTILSRMQRTICTAEELNPDVERTQPNKTIFPLFLREVFKDVARQKDIKLAMCKYEGDLEIASMARKLNCPVLTFDSDYFLFGCQYIPFPTLDSKLSTVTSLIGTYKYIECKLYQIDVFLGYNKGLTQETLHLLPVLLGNDYIDEKVFVPFLQSINIQMTHQRKIHSLLEWLKNETLESAIMKILHNFQTKQNCLSILQNIEKVISGYSYIESRLLSYLDIPPEKDVKIEISSFRTLKRKFLEYINMKTDIENERQDTISVNDHLNTENAQRNTISRLFMKKYQQCQYPSSFMDIVTQNRYYAIPQLENHQKLHSHIYSLDLLSVIHKILTNSSDSEFTVIARGEGTTVKCFPQEKCPFEIPKLEDLEHISQEERKALFLRILRLDNVSLTFLDNFPAEWHIFLIGLKHFLLKNSIPTPLIYCLTLCFIALNYVDCNIGFFRTFQKLSRRYLLPRTPRKNELIRTGRGCFYFFPIPECITFMQKFVHFFEADNRDNSSTFNRDLVHATAEIQSVFLHLKYINSLLDYPYMDLFMHRTFDGTFVYNTTNHFQGISTNLENNELSVMLEECPAIWTGVKYALNFINQEFSL